MDTVRESLPEMENKLKLRCPWTKRQRQLAVEGLRMFLGGKG